MYGFDFGMTKDGDLKLGVEAVNEQGELLYKHFDGSIDTIQQEDSKTIRDVSIIRSKRSIQQVVYNRLKTDNPEWYHHLSMGASLSDLIGEPNTRETASKGVQMISAALTYKNFLSGGEFGIQPVPISASEIMFLLTISIANEEEFRLPLVFDLHRGLKEVGLDEEN